MPTTTGTPRVFDGLALTASALCMVHCLVLPALLALAPALAAVLAFPEEFHVAAFAFAVPTSVIALVFGLRHHRQAAPVALIAPGLVMLGLGSLAVPDGWTENVVTTIGAVLLAAGHTLNWRAAKSARTPSGTEEVIAERS